MLADQEGFLESVQGHRVVLDEVHRLPNPSELLQIAADHYPETKIIATGSSTLRTSPGFNHTMPGRMIEIWLTPMIHADVVDLGDKNLRHRLQYGGLPPFFLSSELPEREYEEWLDFFWARDIQELFRLERRGGFQQCLELLLTQSGGMFDASKLAAPCEMSRTTVGKYLNVLEATRVVHVIRPFGTRRATEIVSAPKVYGFDTGFVRHHRGWSELRPEDWENLWKHYVLNEIQARLQEQQVRYWRDKRGHEVDFIIPRGDGSATTIECKWSTSRVDQKHLAIFRTHYPEGENWLLTPDVDRPYVREEDGLKVELMGLETLAERLGKI